MKKNISVRKNVLIWQVLPILYIVILCTTILCGILMNYYSIDIMLNAKKLEQIHLMEELSDAINRNENAKWYINYWKNNYGDMDIRYDEDPLLQQIEVYDELYDIYVETYHEEAFEGLFFTTTELDDGTILYDDKYDDIDPETLAPEIQKKLAEYVYLVILDQFDAIKSGSNIKHVYCVVPLEDEQVLYLFSGRRQGEIYGNDKDNIYKLGTVGSMPSKNYPSFYETYEKGEIITGEALFHCDNTGNKERYHFYVPICDEDGNVLCIIATSAELTHISELISKPFFVIMAAVIVSMLLCAWIVARVLKTRAITPINRIQNIVEEYSDNKDCKQLTSSIEHVMSHRLIKENEIGMLSEKLSEMGQELSLHIEEVKNMTVKQERLNTELDLATRIQKSALTEDFDCLPKEWNVLVAGSMDPAKEVGGDFYDFQKLDDDHEVFIIGDVSGKGIPASLLMMISLAFFKNECEYYINPGTMMEKINNILCGRSFEDMFVTAWIGVLEISTGKIVSANAGHEYPVIKHKDGTVEVVKDKHGLVLAAMAGSKYKDFEMKLERGDVLMVYTDGVPEAINQNNEQYGVDRLLSCLERNTFEKPDEYIEAVKKDMAEFVQNAEQFDDTTMLVISYEER